MSLDVLVAPCAGAWIETEAAPFVRTERKSSRRGESFVSNLAGDLPAPLLLFRNNAPQRFRAVLSTVGVAGASAKSLLVSDPFTDSTSEEAEKLWVGLAPVLI